MVLFLLPFPEASAQGLLASAALGQSPQRQVLGSKHGGWELGALSGAHAGTC